MTRSHLQQSSPKARPPKSCEFSRIRKPPKSRSRCPIPEGTEGIRKDLAVYASLSSNRIVKEPAKTPPPGRSRVSFGRNRLTGQTGYTLSHIGKTKPQSRETSGPAAGVTLIYSPPPAVSTGHFRSCWFFFGNSEKPGGRASISASHSLRRAIGPKPEAAPTAERPGTGSFN